MPAKPARDELGILGLGGGRWGLFRSIMGLWLIQECRRTWAAEGLNLSHDEIADQAERCDPPAQSLIDPDDPRFLAPANMPREVRAYCAETAQPVPNGPGEIARVVFASLALDCRAGVESLEAAAGLSFRALRMVGGGSANAFLCQLTADATRLPVVAGPVEATAIGNILLQARVMGLVGGDTNIAAIAARSFPVTRHEPTAADDEALYQRFTELRRRRTG